MRFVAYFAARLGDKTRAEQEVKQALKLSPDDDKVMRRVVLTYETLGERDRAIQALSRATPQLLDAPGSSTRLGGVSSGLTLSTVNSRSPGSEVRGP